MRSRIYKGTVGHNRLYPHPHAFRYKVFMMYLDLDELPELFDKYLLWSARSFNLAWFRRKDHLGDTGQMLKQAVLDRVQKETGRKPGGPVCLLTHLRYFGYVMNPVSFYFCWNRTADRVECIVAEVHNTPWGEQHCYVLDAEKTSNLDFIFKKKFHVSPFMSMNQDYHWIFSSPAESIRIYMSSYENGRKIFNAWSYLNSLPVNSYNLAKALVNFPLITVKVILAIYWQAFRLWLKRTPFFEHPKHYMKRENQS